MSPEKSPLLPNDQFQAAILDLDGVITRTAQVHAEAWKQMFDDYLQSRDANARQFDITTDYREYIDGKPRYDGVRSFLESRDIQIPEGQPDDPPDAETVCGLGNRKNDLFREMLQQRGVQVYQDTVDWLRAWRQQGKQTAVISSSKNCALVLEEAGLTDLFDERVDGVVSEELGIEGKPAPDIFLKAAELLDVSPEQSVVFEDAIAGVEAGRAGNFGLVLGVARNSSGEDLLEHGADRIIQSFRELLTSSEEATAGQDPEALPSALSEEGDLFRHLREKTPILFLDYDGTLTPIVKHPEDAVLSDDMRSLLRQLADRFTVAIVSGRDRQDVQNLVGLEELIYAGSHGFDITGPDGMEMQHQAGRKALPDLEEAGSALTSALQEISGAQVERKRFAIAVHYRNASQEDAARIKQKAEQVLKQHPRLKKSGGKKIVELKPDIDWDKGKALLWLLDALDLDPQQVFPLYIGDDLTDEDAFRVLRDRGAGILVGDHGHPTLAHYTLQDVRHVAEFFTRLLHSGKDEQS